MSDDPRRTAPSDKTADTSRLSAEGGGPTVPESRRPPDGPEVMPHLPGYRLVRKVGEGGMGAVYLAEDTQLGRDVAVKTMRPEVAADPASRARFEREARAAAAVEHDNIVPILRVGAAPDGTPFIVMPFLRGEMLDARLKREPAAPPELVLKVAFEVAEGLAAAHEGGLIHRDIKPGNIWLEGDPASPDPDRRVRRCKVLDFGLARSVDGGRDVNLTRTGAVLGTPAYMSPEQARGARVDHRSDLFSLGVMLYRMATGQLPFKGATPMAALIALTTETPPPVGELAPHLPPSLAGLVDRLMAKDPADRPQTAAEVAAAVEQIRAGAAPTYSSLPPAPVVARPRPVEANPWEEATERDADEERPVARRPAPDPPTRSKRPWIIAGVVSVLVVLVALAVILRPGPPEGTLTVAVDADAEAKFASGRLVLYGPDGKERYRLAAAERSKALAAGTYAVKVEGADKVTLDAATFTLKRGAGVTLRVSALRKIEQKDPPKPPAAAADFREVHAVTEGELEKWMAALQRDGYIPSYLGAEAGPAVRFNAVAVPNPNKITWRFAPRDDVNGPRWQADFLARQAAGFRPLVYAPYSDGGPYEAHVWVSDRRTGGGWYGVPAFITDKMQAARADAYRPLALAGTPDGPGARYRVVLGPGDGRDWDSYLGLALDELADEVVRQKKRGWRPEWLAAYQSGGRVRFQALFYEDPGRSEWDYRASLTAKEYEAQLAQRGAAGERPLSVVGYAADGQTRYAVVWVKADPKAAAAPADADRKAAEYVLALGGRVRVDGGGDDIADVKLLPAEPFRLTGANMAANLLNRGQAPTADGLAVFAGCRHLRSLSLHGAKLDEGAYAHFAGCKELTELALDGSDVTDAALAHFKGCRGLKSLNLWSANRVGDAGLAHFKDCESLSQLILAGTQVTAVGLGHFKGCRNLDFIDLYDTRAGDDALKVLEDTPVGGLSLQRTTVTDAGLRHLRKNGKLATLSLIDTAVTDAGLEHLKGLPLVELNLSGGKVTAKGAAAFAATRPRCKVSYNGAVVKPKE